MSHEATVIGAGLAGSEAAWQLAQRGVQVNLLEMRPAAMTPVHRTDGFAELVCSNSFKGMDPISATGALKLTLAEMGSLVLAAALDCRVSAGSALAVDRERFSREVTQQLAAHPNVTIVRGEVAALPAGEVIVATGPMTSPAMVEALKAYMTDLDLAFYDAAAPIVDASSLDLERLHAQSRYGKGGADYLNAFMDRPAYDRFIDALLDADRVIAREFENDELFNACQPVEQVARSGHDALRFGALKPVGLVDPATGHRPWAAVQLRAENAERGAYNLVGFQTNLTFPAQDRVFRMIPGLEHAEFSRYGVMHRNTFIDTPHVLDGGFALPAEPRVRFAGQVTGTEGYLEAVASGLLAALSVYARLEGLAEVTLPKENVFGALSAYATDPQTKGYQPMHVNYGIMPPTEKPIRSKHDRHAALAARSASAIRAFISARPDLRFEMPYRLPDIEER